ARDDLDQAQRPRDHQRHHRAPPPPEQARAGHQHQRHRDPARPGPALDQEAGVRDPRQRQHDRQHRVPAHGEQVPRPDRRGRRGGIGDGRCGGHAPRVRRERPTGRGPGSVPPKGGGPGARPDGSMDPMDLLPDAAGPLGLILLALVDSTSMGTLVIPVILLVVGQGGALRVAGRTLVYLAVIGAFYLLLGIALLAGLLPLLDSFGHLLAAPQVMLVLAVFGVLLAIWSFRLDPKTIVRRGGDPEASARRWTGRARRASGRPAVLIVLALTAGLIEAASMIPYLAAMGILADMQVGLGRGALLLIGYCAVMV